MTSIDFPALPGQEGLATVAQLLEHGLSINTIRHRRHTIWQEPMPRVVAPHRGTISADQRLISAALWAGPKAVLTGAVALSYLGLTTKVQRVATLVAPETARAKEHQRARVVRSTRPVQITRRHGVVPIVRAARALVDAAVYEQHPAQELEHLAIATLQQGLDTPEALAKELHTRPAKAVSAVWKGLDAFADGAWSRPERVLREVVDGDGGFPELLTNCALLSLEDGSMIGTPDGYFKEAGTAIQVQSRQFHQGIDDQGGDRWARTVEKDSEYLAFGIRVVGVTPWTLYRQPKRFLDKLRKVVAFGLQSPPPRVRALPHA